MLSTNPHFTFHTKNHFDDYSEYRIQKHNAYIRAKNRIYQVEWQLQLQSISWLQKQGRRQLQISHIHKIGSAINAIRCDATDLLPWSNDLSSPMPPPVYLEVPRKISGKNGWADATDEPSVLHYTQLRRWNHHATSLFQQLHCHLRSSPITVCLRMPSGQTMAYQGSNAHCQPSLQSSHMFQRRSTPWHRVPIIPRCNGSSGTRRPRRHKSQHW